MVNQLSLCPPAPVLEHLPSVFFICLMLLSCGPPFICASLHGMVINTIQSLSSLDQFRDKDEVLKGLSLKMVELSHQRAYYLFGEPLWTTAVYYSCHRHCPHPGVICPVFVLLAPPPQASQTSGPLPTLPCSRS